MVRRFNMPNITQTLSPSRAYASSSSKVVYRNPDGKVVGMGNTPSSSTSGGKPSTSTGSSTMDKANTLFNGLNLAALPFFFIPFGGAAAGRAVGQQFDPALAVPSAICVSSMSMMVMVVFVIIFMMM